MADLITSATNVTVALAPTFAAGFAIQHADELLDPLISKLSGNSETLKKTLMGWLSFLFGTIVTVSLQLRVVKAFGGPTGGLNDVIDAIVTALIISTGTEGVNSIIKFLGYAKDQKKAAAAQSEAVAGAAMKAVNREP
jgi:hypothetical protein